MASTSPQSITSENSEKNWSTAANKPTAEASETGSEDASASGPDIESSTTLHGFRLYAVAIGLYFGALMMSLDISIIATVRNSPFLEIRTLLD